MAAEHEVMREFLVSLGFVVKDAEQKKFTGALDKTKSLATGTGKAVLAVGLAAQTMVALFTANMEKMYYASKRTGASVENLQAAEFGARNIGLAAGGATASLEAMAAAVRMNPGLRGLMDGVLGKSTAGMDQMDAMLELVQKLSSMPHYAGAQMASMFGVDEKTFLMMKQGMPEMLAAMERRKQLARDMGVDADAAALAAKEYQNMLRDVLEKIEVLGQKFSITLLPLARDFAAMINDALNSLSKLKGIDFGLSGVASEFRDIRKEFAGLMSDVTTFSASTQGQDLFAGLREQGESITRSLLKTVQGILKIGRGDFSGAAESLGAALMGAINAAPGTIAVKKAYAWATGASDAGGGRGASPVANPNVTDADRSVAPGKVDLRNMTADQHAKVMALAAKQFGMRPSANQAWNGINAQYQGGQGDRNAAQMAILQQELVAETNATNRARLEREIGRLGGKPGAAGIAPTGTAASVAAAAKPAAPAAPVTVTQTNNIAIDGMRSDNVDTRMDAVLKRAQADLVRNFKGATQ